MVNQRFLSYEADKNKERTQLIIQLRLHKGNYPSLENNIIKKYLLIKRKIGSNLSRPISPTKVKGIQINILIAK